MSEAMNSQGLSLNERALARYIINLQERVKGLEESVQQLQSLVEKMLGDGR